MYDYLIVGSGLFGSVFARQAADAGRKVVVIDKRPNIAGNVYTEKIVTPEEAAAKIEEQKKEIIGEPGNLEEQAISLVGRDIYEKLVKGYTEKQWGVSVRSFRHLSSKDCQ